MALEYLTAILAFITAIYAYLTHKILKANEASVEAMHDQTEAVLRPYITFTPFIRPHTQLICLRISNTGKTAAKNVNISLDRDFYQYGKSNQPTRNLRNINAFTTPIDGFPPGKELIFSLGQAWVIFGKNSDEKVTPSQFSITAEYDYFGKHITETAQIDLRPYLRSESESDPVVHRLELIKEVMEQINVTLKQSAKDADNTAPR